MELFWIGLAVWVVWVLLAQARVSAGRAAGQQRFRRRARRVEAQDVALRRQNDAHACPLCGVENAREHSCHVEDRWVGKTVRQNVTYPGRRYYRGGRWIPAKPYTRREEVRIYQGVARDRWGAVWTCDHEHSTTKSAAACARERVRMWQVKVDPVPIVAKPPPEIQPVPRRLPIADLMPAAWEFMKQACGYRCAYCGEVSAVLQKEHKIPLSRGGSNAAANIVPSCPRCNYRKGSLTDAEFRERLAAELERGVQQQRSQVIKQAPEHWRTDAAAPKQRARKAVPSSGGKHCPACEQDLPLTEFGSNASRPDGRHHTCRTCAAARAKADRLADPAKERERRQQARARARERAKASGYVAAEKRCASCGVTKPADGFHRDSGRDDGLQRRCRDCRRDSAGPLDMNPLKREAQPLELFVTPPMGPDRLAAAAGPQGDAAATAESEAERGAGGALEGSGDLARVRLHDEDKT